MSELVGYSDLKGTVEYFGMRVGCFHMHSSITWHYHIDTAACVQAYNKKCNSTLLLMHIPQQKSLWKKSRHEHGQKFISYSLITVRLGSSQMES